MERTVHNSPDAPYAGKRFTALFMTAMVSFYGLAGMFGIVPDGARIFPATSSVSAANNASADEQPMDAVPRTVSIPSIGVDANIENPESRAVSVLDSALKDGVVHYPGSGDLDVRRNVFLFGHASNLPVVHNEMYKVFTDLPDVEAGDEITVSSRTHDFRYRVTGVELVDADEALVRFETGKRELTISTCNTFGEKSDRYVVHADFVESSPRAQE